MMDCKRVAKLASTALVLGSVVFALAACSGSSRVRKPAELVQVNNQFELAPVWSTSVGSSESFNFHPAVVGDSVYAASHRGNLTKIDLMTGKKVWEVSVPDRLSIGPGSDGRTTAVVTTKGTVYAYDDTGKPTWNVSVGSEVLSEPVVAGGRFGMIAMANGGLVWETPVSFPKGFSEIERLNDVTAKPSMEGDIICAVSYQGRVGCGQARTGNLLWFKDYSSYTGTAQSPDLVFSSNEKSYVTAFAVKDGSQVWENTQLTFRDVGEPMAVGKVLLVGDAQGYVHALSQANGEMLARIRHDSSPITAAPIAVNGLILVQSQGGKLAAYSPK